ncbi:hypothetical protein GNI_039960 [Gregarina niphandrodes]|uniref:Uncharacterized protein n=1 Tax=Gregarina niphandrodes TaxID=110365 RepID=A0A023BAA9_GRENI|nr:hypothetical protein GNI_039960 [Gregarina niphandrodes]EZG78196.1 hypothetical protein GNI_039960 [Gregarina niphandrodes]|eukprot:XP_011129416.1 hypothetical protein GNI_039960 [Gregarina niphandrodes]
MLDKKPNSTKVTQTSDLTTDDEDDEEEEELEQVADEDTDPLADRELVQKLTDALQTSQKLLTTVRSELATVAKKVVAVDTEMKKEAAERASEAETGVTIKLYEPGATAVPSGAAKKSEGGSEEPIFSLYPETSVTPVIYTQPAVLEEAAGVLNQAENCALEDMTYKFQYVNEQFRSSASLSTIRSMLGFLESNIRSQKEYLEASAAAVSKVMVQGEDAPGAR